MLRIWETLQVVVATLWAQPEVQVIVYHSLVNFIAGVAAALAGVLPTAIFIAIEAALVKDLIDSLARIPGLDSIIGKLPAAVLNTLVKE